MTKQSSTRLCAASIGLFLSSGCAWILRQQTAELEHYAFHPDIPPPELFRRWIDEESYEGLIPSSTVPARQQIFLSDMEVALAALLMRTYSDWAP